VEPPDSRVEPTLERGALPAPRQQQDAKPKLTNDDRIDREISFVYSQPFHHTAIWLKFCRLAQNVRLDEIFHNVSVDSDSIGTK
jgi:hypothetical protein